MPILELFNPPHNPGPDLQCANPAELRRVVAWLEASNVPFGWTQSSLTVRLLKPAAKLTAAEHNAFPRGRWS